MCHVGRQQLNGWIFSYDLWQRFVSSSYDLWQRFVSSSYDLWQRFVSFKGRHHERSQIIPLDAIVILMRCLPRFNWRSCSKLERRNWLNIKLVADDRELTRQSLNHLQGFLNFQKFLSVYFTVKNEHSFLVESRISPL